MESEIKLEIVGLVYNQSVVNTYSLILREASGGRRFSVMIGEPEAQSIVLKMNNKIMDRPLTHDLLNNILITLKAELKKILIHNFIDEIFYSELYIEDTDGRKFVVDARTSDAVALAVRAECPVYIKSDIMNIVGTKVSANKQDTDVGLDDPSETNLSDCSLVELKSLLSTALDDEHYEFAVQIRDTIKNKQYK